MCSSFGGNRCAGRRRGRNCPAVRLARANLNLILREGGRGVAGGSSRFRDALVMVQVGTALMLLIIAALFTRSLSVSEHANLGFNPGKRHLLTMDPGEIGYSGPQVRDFYQALLDRIRALPGVEAATTASSTPMGLISNSPDTVNISGSTPNRADHAHCRVQRHRA